MSKIYSNSRLWLYESCPEYYKLKYIDKTLPKIPEKVNLFLGSAVHESLEWLYGEIKKSETVGMDELILHFVNYWKENFSLDFKIKSGETEDDQVNRGVKFLVDYYQKNKPFAENTLYLEKRILFPLDVLGEYQIQGYIDRLVLNENGEYEVHDYKTNAFMKRQKEIDEDRQLAFYHLGLQELFGKNVTVKLVWHFLAHNVRVSSSRTQVQLDKLKGDTLDLIKSIESTTHWHACGKRWCDWCEYKRVNRIELAKESSISFRNESLGRYF